MLPYSAADKRAGNSPAYIHDRCPICKEKLVLADLLDNPQASENEIWHDEFICPNCQDGVYMDWPDDYRREIKNRPQWER